MDITPLVSSNSQIVQGYAAGRFKVGGKDYHSAILVYPDRVESFPIDSFDALSADHLQPVLKQAGNIDVVLLGCGAKMQFVPPALRKLFSDNGLSLEPMDSGAACRTYNVLMAEGRRVAAILLPV